MTQPESPWTVSEAACWLKRSEEWVREQARAEKIPGVRFGREWRFDPAVIRAMIPAQPAEPIRSDLARTLEARLNASAARIALRRTS